VQEISKKSPRLRGIVGGLLVDHLRRTSAGVSLIPAILWVLRSAGEAVVDEGVDPAGLMLLEFLENWTVELGGSKENRKGFGERLAGELLGAVEAFKGRDYSVQSPSTKVKLWLLRALAQLVRHSDESWYLTLGNRLWDLLDLPNFGNIRFCFIYRLFFFFY
jgi:hypothetical protein